MEKYIGRREEWEPFVRRNPWIMEASIVGKLMDRAIRPETSTTGKVPELDKYVQASAIVCWDLFSQIMVTAGNGFGAGALIVLRSMFEWQVTARYLQRHPEELKRFEAYEAIRLYKMSQSMIAAGYSGDIAGTSRAQIEAGRESVKGQFVRTCTCTKTCAASVPAFGWADKDLVAMAREVGMGNRVWSMYQVPLNQAHPSMQTILARLGGGEVGTVLGGSQPEAADAAVRAALLLVLDSVELQIEHFRRDDLKVDLLGAYDALKKATGNWQDPPEEPRG